MKIHVIDNSIKNLGKTVLWQYDRAVRLLAILKHMQVMYHCAVEQFWDFWTKKVLSIDTCGSFGCSLWGMFLGVPRPSIVENGQERLIATSVYRRILKGTFYLMKSGATFKDILGYLEIIFGVGGDENLSKWSDYVSEYGWTTNIEELNDAYIPGIAYYAGEVVWHHEGEEDPGENWKFTRNVSAQENKSWEDISSAVVRTTEETTRKGGGETLLLKLYDPEGICRKIGGAPSNSLSISVSYEFGETTIVATATRRRKCGVALIDNGDMSMTYAKSPYYDEMHRDQKYIFEQKLDEFCPYPLGIKTNEPVGNWVFGFVGQSNVLYAAGMAYAVGDVFGYEDESGNAYNWKCREAISAAENTSFDAIKGKLDKTSEGGPFIDTLAEDYPPYLTVRNRITESVSMMVSQNSVASIFPPNYLFECRENGLTKVFRNTTEGYLVVCHSSEEEWEGMHPSGVANFVAWEFVEDPTPDNIMDAMGRISRSSGCPALNYDSAAQFIPGVTYNAGMVVLVDGEERIVTTARQMNSKDDIMAYSIPQRKSCLHKFYPYKTIS